MKTSQLILGAVFGCCLAFPRLAAMDRIVDADGAATAGDGIPDAVEVQCGDPLTPFTGTSNAAGLDWFDSDASGDWSDGDDLHLEDPSTCPTAIRNAVHDLGKDCKVLDYNNSLVDLQPVSCDLPLLPPCPPKLKFHDANGNGQYDPPEDIVFDTNDNGIYDLDAECAGLACPLSQGYWKNHLEDWPISVEVCGLMLGTVNYTAAEVLALLNTPVGDGKKADASLILAHQLIAAKLNLGSCADPDHILATIAMADGLIDGSLLPMKVAPKSAPGKMMTALAERLDRYNNGMLTPCVCGYPMDIIVDADGAITAGDGIPDAVEVECGDPLTPFAGTSNAAGLDWFDSDANGDWSYGDDLHLEDPSTCPTAIRNAVHDLGKDCKVLDYNNSLVDLQPVSCDLPLLPPCPPKLKFHDANGNGQYDPPEDIVYDSNDDGFYN